MKTRITLPEEIVKEVDEIAGRENRQMFIENSIRNQLSHARAFLAMTEQFKKFPMKPPPWFSTPEKTTAWVRATRDNDQEKLRELGWPGEPDEEG